VRDQLDEVYEAIPDAGCRGLCVPGCTSMAMTPLEQRRIAERHGVTLPLATAPLGTPILTPGQVNAEHCAALDRHGLCSVYADRPLVCRLFGATDDLECPYGCTPVDGPLPRTAARHLFLRVITLSSDANR
jgi:uncharacterized protein